LLDSLLQENQCVMFGGKTGGPAPPRPPTVDQLLDDLKSADLHDPVYNLSRDILGGLIDEEGKGGDLADPNVLYNKVIEYVGSAGDIDQLCTKISRGTDALEESHQELKKLAEEVQNNLKGIKDPGAGKPFQPESIALGPKDTAEENHQAIVSKQTNDIESDQISESDKIRESGQIGESDQISDKGSEKEEEDLC